MNNRCVLYRFRNKRGYLFHLPWNGPILAGDLGRLSDLPEPSDVQVKATGTRFGCVRVRRGEGLMSRCLMGSISMKPH